MFVDRRSHLNVKMDTSLSTAFFLVVAVCACGCLAENADLTISQLLFTSPSPDQDAPIYAVDNAVSVVLVTFFVDNNGPDNLAAAVTGNNYDVRMYLSDGDNMTDPREVTTFGFSDFSGNRAKSLNANADDFYLAQNFDLTYPSSLCPTHSHVCVQVEKEPGAVYTDPDNSNNFQCQPFIRGSAGVTAGFTDCPSDPVPYNLTLLDTDTFIYNEEASLTMSVSLENQGGAAVPGSTANEDNIAFTRFFIASTPSESAEILTDFTDSLSYTYSDVSEGLEPWGEATYYGFEASITLPEENCHQYCFICLVFSPGVNATYDDTSSNNLVCGGFGDPSHGGIAVTVCPLITRVQPTPSSGLLQSGGSGVTLDVASFAAVITLCLLGGAVIALFLVFGIVKLINNRQKRKVSAKKIDVQPKEAYAPHV
ncbi:uncharacterized protein [Ptychodera flava]|uniref:uncharacterized protein n=1 Tax=Ptychodera flava TaxID=63121 RepID=UPI003969EC6E